MLVKIGANLVNPARILWINIVPDSSALIVFGGDEDFRIVRQHKDDWQELMAFIDQATIAFANSADSAAQ